MRHLPVEVLLEHADPAQPLCAPSPMIAGVLLDHGWAVIAGRLEDQQPASFQAAALLEDELSRAGEDAEALLAEAARVLVPGGLLAVSARSGPYARAIGVSPRGLRLYTAAELSATLGQRGFGVEVLVAPGAASGLRGVSPAYDPELDRAPGLLDAAERIVAIARWAPDEQTRSRRFFASLPRKVVATDVVCRDDDGRLLMVFDSYRGHWTLPGGVVDADEDLRAAAEREAWEEGGVRVRAGQILGLFSASWPDRVVIVFEAALLEPAPSPQPLHHHEIERAAWMPLDEALRSVPPQIGFRITRAIRQPGGAWHT